jgi:hypothetical protein
MLFLQLDDMLDLIKYEQAELHRQAARDALADSAKQHRQTPNSSHWPVVLASALLIATITLALFIASMYSGLTVAG